MEFTMTKVLAEAGKDVNGNPQTRKPKTCRIYDVCYNSGRTNFFVMASPGNNLKWLLLISAGVAVALAFIWWPAHRTAELAPQPVAQNQIAPAQPAPSPSAATNEPAALDKASASAPARSRLQAICDELRSANAASARLKLAELRRQLAAMPVKAAVAEVRQFLDAKTDAATHLGFKLASNGTLDDAPTMRTFLLDELGRLDPAAAADYSKIILDSKDSPDEWAVALRNLANGDSSDSGRALLAQKTGELLNYEPWQQNPSVGYLEAFDAAVYLGGTDLLPTLSSLVQKQDNPAVAHAAYLALDRLVISNPAATLAALEASPDSMDGREATRANYFARADVRDPQQRQVLESYLLNPNISPAEISTFAGVYPNANYMISANLLTPTPTPDRSSLTSEDAQSLAVVQQWLADPRFANLTPQLQRMSARLQTFVQQASH